MTIKNVFCDRDGTIIYDKHYLHDPNGVELLPTSAAALQKLSSSGKDIFIVTNQSGIGRGMFSLNDYRACEARLELILAGAGVLVKATAFCPHAPVKVGGDMKDGMTAMAEEAAAANKPELSAVCNCRKPATGMWDELQAKFALNAAETCMIGDKIEDIRFGKACGFAASILVLTGKGEYTAASLGFGANAGEIIPKGKNFIVPVNASDMPDCIARDLAGAAEYIMALS